MNQGRLGKNGAPRFIQVNLEANRFPFRENFGQQGERFCDYLGSGPFRTDDAVQR